MGWGLDWKVRCTLRCNTRVSSIRKLFTTLVGKDVEAALVLGLHLFIQSEVEILRVFTGASGGEGLMLWESLPRAGLSDFEVRNIWCWGERNLRHTDPSV